ncbi:MAG: hypothetical protein EA376_05645 [Phycisphaeraceae bacterium]|nr:MAG: hypothetical protein EA376_05645 [Phycisphaeraceae bacterium]
MRCVHRTRRRERTIAPIMAATISLAAAVLLCGCASTTTSESSTDPSQTRFGRQLEVLAQREASRPSSRAREAPAPPGVDSALLSPVDEADADAHRSLSDVVANLAAQRNTTPLVIDETHEKVDSIAPPEALRRYVAAREHRLSGDLRSAVAELEEVVRLDPDAAAPWRELGDAYAIMGDRLMAVASYREALRRDPEDMRSLVQVGLATLDRRQHADAASLLSRAWLKHEGQDPALRHIISLGLGRALLELGFISAGVEALAIAADLPDRYGDPTIYRSELAEVYRDRGDAWREIGDAATRLGRHDEALEAYDNAASLPTLDPGAIAPRRVNAAMQLGRPAVAAMAVLGEIISARGQVEDRHMRLIEYLSQHGGSSAIREALASAIAEVEASLPEEERLLASGRLARARAAALSSDRALDILRDRLAKAPADESALADLYRRLDPDDVAGLLRQTIQLVQAAPLETSRYAAALLRLPPSAELLIETYPTLRLRGADADAGSLLLARLHEITGDVDAASAELRRLIASRPDFAPAVAALARTLAQDGRRTEALELLEDLDIGEDAELRYASAILLQSLGRHAEALERIEPLLDDEAPLGAIRRATIFLRAAEISQTMERWGEARRLSERAVELDPTLEEAYGFLISLHGPGGQLADQRRLTDTVRRLRTAVPSSRTLRWLRAQDLVRAGQFDQAERELVSLAEDDPSKSVIELLVILWMRTGSEERAEQWLKEKVEQRPTDAAPRLELARVLAARGKGEESAQTLRDWLEMRPNDLAAMRRLEAVLREVIGDVDQADAMALRRMERSGTPDSIRGAMELAEILIRRDDIESAAEALLTGLRGDGAVQEDDAKPLAQLANFFARSALAEDLDPMQGAAILDRALGKLSPGELTLHADLLRLLSAIGAPVERMSRALNRAVRQHGDQADNITNFAIGLLGESERAEDALRLLEGRVQGVESPNAAILDTWLKLAAYLRDIPSIERAARAISDAGLGDELIRINSRAPRSRLGEPRATAELLYNFAQSYSFEGMADDADEVYRVALRIDPTHPMANNNLGYRMTERYEDLDEAYRMLQIAYQEEPDEYNVVDSIGWVRYKLGVFHDEVDANGDVVREGAISLLRKSTALIEKQPPSPVRSYGQAIITDHLADALWRVGEREEAEALWRASQTHLEALRVNQTIADEEFRELAESVDAKIDALEAGEEPAIAPTAEEFHEMNGNGAGAAVRSDREGR